MWQTTLTPSLHQAILSSCGYLLLLLITLYQFSIIYWVILVPLLLTEWWRSIGYFQSLKGEMVIFHIINQLYWQHERFYIISQPLLLHPITIIHLKSRKNGKKRTLFLCRSNFSHNDWRSLHYYLQQIIL
ncbi:protein YgfX [Orbaceae bacterium ESL0721]|nr:protein YgfX [Orbaceae bacterium ESL0721]